MGKNDVKVDKTVAFMALIFGTIITFCGLYLLILNNYTSATGTVGLTGGTIVPAGDDIFFEISEVTDGGQFGLAFGIVVGLIANAFQFVSLVIRDKDIFKDNPKLAFWTNIFDVGSRIFDFATAYWYTTFNHVYFPANAFANGDAAAIASGIGTWLFHVTVIVMFLTMGSEIFLFIGLKLIARYGKDGVLSIFSFFSNLFGIWEDIQNSMAEENSQLNIGNRNDRRDKPNFQPTPFQQPPEKRRPGRPPKNLGGERSASLDLTALLQKSPIMHSLED